MVDVRPTVIGSPGGKLASGLSQADPRVAHRRSAASEDVCAGENAGVTVFDGAAHDLDAAPRAPEWLASAHAVAACAKACLGPALVGVYVHGSAALGGWLAHVSDLDILVVTDGAATRGVLVPFGEETSGLARSGAASGIELSVIDRELARDPRAPWNYLLHVAAPFDPRSTTRVAFDKGVVSARGDVKELFNHVRSPSTSESPDAAASNDLLDDIHDTSAQNHVETTD